LSAGGALEIAAEVAGRRITAATVIANALEDIARRSPAFNAFTTVFADTALEDARKLDAKIASGATIGRFAGVPFAVKNLFDVAGVTTLAGAKLRRSAAPAERDAILISRLKTADAILVGTLNMDEFAYGFVTENAHYGPAHNPHDLARIAGGSSGGSAAAVAAGLVPLALGSDTNGSVRVPAGLCGVFGLKPTFGRLSRKGMFPFVDSLDHAGLFARTVEDLAVAYDVVRAATRPKGPNSEAPGRRLRVGVLGGWFVEGAFPEVLESLGRVGGALGAMDGVVLPGAEAARSAAFCMTAYEGGRLHAADLRTRPQDFDPAVRDRLLAGALLPNEAAAAARAYRPIFREHVRRVFEEFDILIAPATPCPAPLIGQGTMMLHGEQVSVRRNLGAYTQPLSYIGLPVLAAPVNRPGLLPVGIQIVAPAWREDLAFAAARQLEQMGVCAAHSPGAVR
jgi:AtzE family amidohydrolase